MSEFTVKDRLIKLMLVKNIDKGYFLSRKGLD
jgi:hypothetical protein